MKTAAQALEQFIGQPWNDQTKSHIDQVVRQSLYNLDSRNLYLSGSGETATAGQTWVLSAQDNSFYTDSSAATTQTITVGSNITYGGTQGIYEIPYQDFQQYVPGRYTDRWTVEVQSDQFATMGGLDTQIYVSPGATRTEYTGFHPWAANQGNWEVTVDVNSPYLWVPDKKQQFRDKIRQQLAGDQANHLGRTRRSTAPGADFSQAKANELTALRLLRKMVTADEFRKYLKYGIISVRGPSGLVYKIQRKDHMIDVYQLGKLVSRLCVYVHNPSIPPTDDVITKMVIVQCDEHNIWQRANINWHGVPKDFQRVSRREFTKDTLIQLAS